MKTRDTKTAFRMTPEAIRHDEARDYNPREWDKVIDRYLAYNNAQFFKINRDDVFSYDRFYVVYTLDNGMKVMNSVSYSSSLTNGGFLEAFIFEFDENFNFYDNGRVEISTRLMSFRDEDGNEKQGTISNNKKGIEYMVKMSQVCGAIWTKQTI
jgi:hypothetical protein